MIAYVPENNARLKEYRTMFAEKHKTGEWTVTVGEIENMGYSQQEMFAAVCLIVEDGITVTKDEFVAIMHEAAGNAPLAQAATAREEA